MDNVSVKYHTTRLVNDVNVVDETFDDRRMTNSRHRRVTSALYI